MHNFSENVFYWFWTCGGMKWAMILCWKYKVTVKSCVLCSFIVSKSLRKVNLFGFASISLNQKGAGYTQVHWIEEYPGLPQFFKLWARST